MSKKIRIGVLGATRGLEIVERSVSAFEDIEVVAICDIYQPILDQAYQKCLSFGKNVRCVKDFSELLTDDIDAVILANYATEHAPYAIKALKAGKHVMSEVLPTQNMAEAVELVEAVEESGKVYAYAEQYCYFDTVFDMRLRFERGEIGDLVLVEGEFIHDCSSKWPRLTRGGKDHWRNHVPSTFYCTHSIGPMLYITGARPLTIVGAECAPQDYMTEMGARSGSAAIEMMTLTGGAVGTSKHGNLRRGWRCYFAVYGTKGTLENDHHEWHQKRGYELLTAPQERDNIYQTITPKWSEEISSIKKDGEQPETCALRCFIGAINGDPVAKKYMIDVYAALDMSIPGLLAHRSLLNGNMPIAMPDFRDKAQREKYRNDRACTDPKVAGDQVLPSTAFETLETPQEVYDRVHERFLKGETD